MELRQIQYFIQLYKDLNITKASKNLYISQQGLSKSVNRLEEELEFPLFERHTFGVVPTKEADMLYTHFNKISSSYHELLLAIDNIHQNRVLRITAFHGFALSCEKNLFSEYRELHPDAQIHYEEKANKDIVSYLLCQKSDIAFMLAPIPKELISLHIVRREPIYMVMDSHHPLASKNTVHIDDIYDQQLLLLDIMEDYNHIILKKADISNTTYHIYDMVSMNEFFHILHASSMIGFSSRLIFQYYDFPEIKFIPFSTEEYPDLVMETHLTAPAGMTPDFETQQYIDYATDRLKDSPWGEMTGR
ncbi:MAG: LysR family transcriptional regulator [Clostridiales bacterium]|nr:LysR family transcriptional regulator [Clostridiales bacterium]